MRMLRMHRIMNRVDVSRRLSMMARIMRPMATCYGARCAIELMVFLRGSGGYYTRNLHRRRNRHGVVTGWEKGIYGGTRGIRGSRGWPFGRIWHPCTDGRHAVALVRFAIPKTLGERVTGNFELRYPMVLVRGDRGESSLWKGKCLEVLRARIRRRAWWRRSDHYVTTWLITVHRIQDNLQCNIKRALSTLILIH